LPWASSRSLRFRSNQPYADPAAEMVTLEGTSMMAFGSGVPPPPPPPPMPPPPPPPAVPDLPPSSMLAFGSPGEQMQLPDMQLPAMNMQLPAMKGPAMSMLGSKSMVAFGGHAMEPEMTQEQLESLPNPGDVANAALGASAAATLEAATLGTTPEADEKLVEDGSSPPAVPDAPAPDDDSMDPEADDSADGHTIGMMAHPVDADAAAAMPVAPIDMMARATQDVDQQTAVIAHAKAPAHPPLVSMIVCAKAQKQLKAMSCSLVTQISGYPEGCECRMKAKKCPAVRRDLGFTGVSPSIPLSPPQLGGVTVILCMYWQWLAPVDRSKEAAVQQQAVNEDAQALVKSANTNAENGAKIVATANFYAHTAPPTIIMTTMPVPATPAPILDPIRFMSTTPYNPGTTTFPFTMPFTMPYRPMPGPAPAPAPFGFMPFAPMFSFGPAPAPAPFNPFAPIVTALMAPVLFGSALLTVQSTVGCMIGSQVIIDQYTPFQEVNAVAGLFGGMNLKFPLKYNHALWAKVSCLPAGAPAPGPAGFAPGAPGGPAGPAGAPGGPAGGPAPVR